MSTTISSYIPSLGAAATRNADVLPFPFPARPQAMTTYVRFVELGTVLDILGSMRLLEITSSGSNAPRLIILEASGNYRIHHENNNSSVTATLAVAPSFGDTVELVGQLNADGSVVLIQSINKLAATTTAASSALTFADAWSGALLWLGSHGTGKHGFVGFRNLVFHRGVQSLEIMRRLAGV